MTIAARLSPGEPVSHTAEGLWLDRGWFGWDTQKGLPRGFATTIRAGG